MLPYFYWTKIRALAKRAIEKNASFRTNNSMTRSKRGLIYATAAFLLGASLYKTGLNLFKTYGSYYEYDWILPLLGLRLVRQVVEVLFAKSFMSIKQPQPWANVAGSNAYYLIFLGLAFKQSDGYLTIPFMAGLNVSISFIEYLQVMKMKKLDVANPGLINQSVFLIWFEDIALVEFCEIIIPAVFAIVLAFWYQFCPNKNYSSLFNEEAFNYDSLVHTEICLLSYIALEILSFTIKRHNINKEFNIDLLQMLQFSLSKNGIQLACGIMGCISVTILDDLVQID